MFENISKGEFVSRGRSVISETEDGYVLCTCSRLNAPFIAYCFNLQQRYDISKLGEAVKLLEQVPSWGIVDEYNVEQIEQLLKQIKK